MSYYNFYLQRLVGGNVPYTRHRLSPGQIVSFRYQDEKNSRKLPRMVLVLNRINLGGSGPMVHGITLENVPYGALYKFLKKVIVYDTIDLIKRKYELKGPFGEIIERPKSFYKTYVKPNLMEYDCYRTYKLVSMKQVKVWMLNWKKLNVYPSSVSDVAMIDKNDKLSDILTERAILEKNLGVSLSNIRNISTGKLKEVIRERFSTEENFIKILENLEKFVDENPDDIDKKI